VARNEIRLAEASRFAPEPPALEQRVIFIFFHCLSLLLLPRALKCVRFSAIADCCARTVSGHAAAAPPSVAKNFRRSMWLAM
jgi:hypothetical protein